MEKDKKTLVYEAALKWAKQRLKYRRTHGSGMASCRAALCRRADELSELVLSDDK